jgi:hypothetical protein
MTSIDPTGVTATTNGEISDMVSLRSRLVDLEDKFRRLQQQLQELDQRQTTNTSVDVMVAYCEQ